MSPPCSRLHGHRHGRLRPADQKTDPAIVAELALDGLLAGEPEVLADDLTRAT
jgi:hypothetical protein